MSSKQPQAFYISLKVLVCRGSFVLALRSVGPGVFHGAFDLPGGRASLKDHDPESTIYRELGEELGPVRFHLVPTPIALTFTDLVGIGAIAYAFYVAEYESGEIKISREHDNFEWVLLSIRSLNRFAPALRPGVKALLELRDEYAQNVA